MTKANLSISVTIRLAVAALFAAVFAAIATHYLWSGVIRWDPLEGLFALRGAIASDNSPWSSDVLAGPGSYLLSALSMRGLGHTYAAARILLSLEIGLLAGLMTAVIVKRSQTWYWGCGSVLTLLAWCSLSPRTISLAHPWDGAVFEALTLALLLWERPLAAGASAFLTIFITPALIPLSIAQITFLFSSSSPDAGRYATGWIAALSLVGAPLGVLSSLTSWWAIASGSTRAIFLNGGAAGIGGTTGVFLVIAVLIILGVVLQRNGKGFWVASATGMLVSISTANDLDRLVLSLPFILVSLQFAAIARFQGMLPVLSIASLSLAIILLGRTYQATEIVHTPVGPITTTSADAPIFRWLADAGIEGEHVLVYPFAPTAYFVSGAVPAVPEALYSRGDYESDSAALSQAITGAHPTVIKIVASVAQHPKEPVTVSQVGDYPEASMLLDNEYAERDSAVAANGVTFFRMTPLTSSRPAKPPELGAQDARLVITEFADFQCPFCREQSDALERLFSGPLGRRAKLVFRNAPLPSHSWARAAAEDASCVNRQSQAAFWQLHHRLYADQDLIHLENIHQYIRAFVVGDASLDVMGFDSCVSNSESVADTADDVKLARAARIRALPTLVVRDERIEGVRTLVELKEIISKAERRSEVESLLEKSHTCRAIRN